MQNFIEHTYATGAGILVRRTSLEQSYGDATSPLVEALDERRGVLLASSFEYPGRYTRWDIGFVDPPIEIACNDRSFTIRALNERGGVVLPALAGAAQRLPEVEHVESDAACFSGRVGEPDGDFAEEDRSRQPSVFSVLRAIVAAFASPEDAHLGLYGAFGYDLAFQFEPIRRSLPRAADHRDLVLYLPDEILVVDHRTERATAHRYDFDVWWRLDDEDAARRRAGALPGVVRRVVGRRSRAR